LADSSTFSVNPESAVISVRRYLFRFPRPDIIIPFDKRSGKGSSSKKVEEAFWLACDLRIVGIRRKGCP
jgi:hypothetical protein